MLMNAAALLTMRIFANIELAQDNDGLAPIVSSFRWVWWMWKLSARRQMVDSVVACSIRNGNNHLLLQRRQSERRDEGKSWRPRTYSVWMLKTDPLPPNRSLPAPKYTWPMPKNISITSHQNGCVSQPRNLHQQMKTPWLFSFGVCEVCAPFHWASSSLVQCTLQQCSNAIHT